MNGDKAVVSNPIIRWFYPTPGRLLVLLLAADGILFLCDWFRWTPKGWAVLMAIAADALTIVVMLLWFAVALVFRWRFQFSIRSLMLLTVAVGISFSWLAYEMRQAQMQRDAVEQLLKYDNVFVAFSTTLNDRAINELAPPAWLLSTFGDEFFGNYVCVDFSLSKITDEDLKYLCALKELNTIDLSRTEISDEGVRYIPAFNSLRTLYLRESRITDVGLKHLRQMSRLRHLTLYTTQVTDAGVAELQKALPNCKIER
jgi:hypothetical protein